MAKPFVVSISHELGLEEAKRRLSGGLARAKADYARYVTIKQDSWQGDRLFFEVVSFGQTASGFVDVSADHATLTVKLPLLLAVMAEKAKSLVTKEGQLLLGKK